MIWLLHNDWKNAKSFGWIVVTTHRRDGVFQALLTADGLTVDTVSKFHCPISEGDSFSGQYVTWSFVFPSLCRDFVSGHYITWSFLFRL
jgi:hypothetical protein